MPIQVDPRLTPQALVPQLERVFELSAGKIRAIERKWDPADGAPVFTVRGRYTARGWTEWTQGFQYGSALLQFDATGAGEFLELGRRGTRERMAPHVSHVGVHDHGFNNVSTYGTLLRLSREGRLPLDARENDFCELALKVSGAVQASRWTRLADGTGFIHSFNGSHSLFVDTLRSCRSLALAHQLGHVLMGEQDERISLLDRLLDHALNTARYNIYYGEGRDAYDVRGRTAHEAVFNATNGQYRCPSTQQGYSPFSTWTRGLAWAICGFAELLQFLAAPGAGGPTAEPALGGDRRATLASIPRAKRRPGRPGRGSGSDTRVADSVPRLLRAALATADFYLESCCADGVPMWDTGAPHLHRLPADYLSQPSNPFNRWEPVDSSAATIAAQGLWRLGSYLALRPRSPQAVQSGPAGGTSRTGAEGRGISDAGQRYRQAALTMARTLFAEPYLSTDRHHQGLILHSVYHRPNGWDFISPGQRVPNGESSMWGDYHARELAVMLRRAARGESDLTFFLPVSSGKGARTD